MATIILKDHRDSSFKLEGLEHIKNYLTNEFTDYSKCNDAFDVNELLEEEQAGVAGYYCIEEA